MEKYAVVQEAEKLKTAAVEKKERMTHCPKCGEELIENNQFLLWCGNCGTEPFEKKTK